MRPFNKKNLSTRLISLGCVKNTVDSELILGQLQKENFHIKNENETTDIAIVNTCGFIGEAKEESINTILELAEQKKKGELQKIVVTGCLSQRYHQELPDLLNEVDLFLGAGDFKNITQAIKSSLNNSEQKNFIRQPNEVISWDLPRVRTTAPYTSYTKISEGCSHKCSFCTIPLMRGSNVRSRPIDDIIKEIQNGSSQGIKEFNLIAQDLNEYGRDLPERPSLTQLFEAIATIQSQFWLRPLYMYPLQFPDKLIRVLANHPQFCSYIDIPLQHIVDRILQSMKRGSSSKYIYRLLEKLKKEIPQLNLRTTFIVGYPGETDKDFEKLTQFIKEIQFDNLGVFCYSDEEDTSAFHKSHKIEDKIKEERKNTLLEIQQEISLQKNQQYTNKTIKVLFEGRADKVFRDSYHNITFQGRHAGQAPDIDGLTLIEDHPKLQKLKAGEFLDIEITKAEPYDLIGKIKENPFEC